MSESNIDVCVGVGTIFSVLRLSDEGSREEAMLQPGSIMYVTSVALLNAQNLEEQREDAEDWDSHLVMVEAIDDDARSDRNIRAGGRVPRILPVPGIGP